MNKCLVLIIFSEQTPVSFVGLWLKGRSKILSQLQNNSGLNF